MKAKINNMKLANKIALIISFLLIVIFTLIILFALSSSQKAITSSTYAELEAVSKSNALQAQAILDAASSAAQDICTYIEDAYAKETASGSASAEKTEDSEIYRGLKLTRLGREVEEYMISTISNVVKNNENITAAGFGFEPYKFAPEQESYSYYISIESGSLKTETLGEYADYKKENYYTSSSESLETSFTAPFEYNGTMMIKASVPIIYNNELQGVIMVDIGLDKFSTIDATSEDYPSMFSTLLMNDGVIVYDSKEAGANSGVNMGDYYLVPAELETVNALMAKEEAFQIDNTGAAGKKVARFFYPIKAGNHVWMSSTVVGMKDVNAPSNKMAILLIIVSVISLCVTVVVVFSVLVRMLKPIDGVVNAAREISKGNLDVVIESKTNDEIGILAKAFGNTIQMLKSVITDISVVLGAISDNNLNVHTNAEYAGELQHIEEAVNAIITNLNFVMKEINQSAEQVAGGSEQLAGASQSLAQGATDQASSVEELLATVNEVTDKVQKNAQIATDASEKVESVGDEVEKSNQQMQETIAAMTQIADVSKQIESIIGTIESIASQTNLLSLNASIEAARAGEAGKGFAVVAGEISDLASQSANAAKHTRTLIESTVKAVENGSSIVSATNETLKVLVEKIEEIVVTVDSIAQESNLQAESMREINEGIEQISRVVESNSAISEESAATSEELSAQAQSFKQMVEKFKLKNE